MTKAWLCSKSLKCSHCLRDTGSYLQHRLPSCLFLSCKMPHSGHLTHCGLNWGFAGSVRNGNSHIIQISVYTHTEGVKDVSSPSVSLCTGARVFIKQGWGTSEWPGWHFVSNLTNWFCGLSKMRRCHVCTYCDGTNSPDKNSDHQQILSGRI